MAKDEALAKRFEMALAHAGMSQRSLARNLEISQATIGQMKAGRHPGRTRWKQIAVALGTTTSWLCDGLGLPPWEGKVHPRVKDEDDHYQQEHPARDHAKRCEDMLADLLQAMRRQTEAIEAMRADISKLAAGPAANPLTSVG